MARFGRVALLGCTRDKHFEIDYYTKVHSPGITLIGAHTNARPDKESHPGWFSHRDDIAVVLKLIGKGRLNLAEMIRETHKPSDCTEVYTRLVNDKNFPIVVQFDWRDE
jgi:threonine dehydrogenase-like Zn-dependent dehydrogenase